MFKSVSSLCGFTYFFARFGGFGCHVIDIYADDEFDTVSYGILYNTAYWIPADLRTMIYESSVKPIRFNYLDECRSSYSPEAQWRRRVNEFKEESLKDINTKQ